ALEKDQFELHYQAYYNNRLERIGVEALIRWNHPEKGLLFPQAFLPLAEATGFIIHLEEWVLNNAINAVKKLQQIEQRAIALSVNVSAEQFKQQNFPSKIIRLLQIHSFKPEL